MRISIIWLFVFGLTAATAATASGGKVQTRILQCAQLPDDVERLACFDEVAESLSTPVSQVYSFKPEAFFLATEIRVHPAVSEYSINVGNFLDLMRAAVVDETDHVRIDGWERKGESYILHFVLRHSGQVEFVYHGEGKERFSVMTSVIIGGRVMDPDQFIFNIAAMVPEEK